MFNRRKFLQLSSLGIGAVSFSSFTKQVPAPVTKPIVISTWDAGIAANEGAWQVLKENGAALDAVEQGVRVTEDSNSCCVGLNGNPDRDGFVTLDACIMDHQFRCGSVAFLEHIKHPISVARRVMEKTPHVMLAGEGALQFAIAEGFPVEPTILSKDAQKEYQHWLQKSEYKPVINVENKGHGPAVPTRLSDGSFNHDTIAMLALDVHGNLSGSCTTSGMAFKMRGRVGDSPIIGAGLYVDNEVGAAGATGQGEEVIRIAGAHLIVEYMRNGDHPATACKKAVERIVHIRKDAAKTFQVAFIALNKKGEYGSYCIQKGFNYAVASNAKPNTLFDADYMYDSINVK